MKSYINLFRYLFKLILLALCLILIVIGLFIYIFLSSRGLSMEASRLLLVAKNPQLYLIWILGTSIALSLLVTGIKALADKITGSDTLAT